MKLRLLFSSLIYMLLFSASTQAMENHGDWHQNKKDYKRPVQIAQICSLPPELLLQIALFLPIDTSDFNPMMFADADKTEKFILHTIHPRMLRELASFKRTCRQFAESFKIKDVITSDLIKKLTNTLKESLFNRFSQFRSNQEFCASTEKFLTIHAALIVDPIITAAYAQKWLKKYLNDDPEAKKIADELPTSMLAFLNESGDACVAQKLKRLSQIGINVTKEGPYGDPMSRAIAVKRLQCVKMLFDLGVDVNAMCASGAPPLALAASSGSKELVEIILNREDLLIDTPDKVGSTALLYAAACGHLKIAKMLVTAGADCTLKNNAGLTASMLAYNKGGSTLGDYLKEQEKLKGQEVTSKLSKLRFWRSK